MESLSCGWQRNAGELSSSSYAESSSRSRSIDGGTRRRTCVRVRCPSSSSETDATAAYGRREWLTRRSCRSVRRFCFCRRASGWPRRRWRLRAGGRNSSRSRKRRWPLGLGLALGLCRSLGVGVCRCRCRSAEPLHGKGCTRPPRCRRRRRRLLLLLHLLLLAMVIGCPPGPPPCWRRREARGALHGAPLGRGGEGACTPLRRCGDEARAAAAAAAAAVARRCLRLGGMRLGSAVHHQASCSFGGGAATRGVPTQRAGQAPHFRSPPSRTAARARQRRASCSAPSTKRTAGGVSGRSSCLLASGPRASAGVVGLASPPGRAGCVCRVPYGEPMRCRDLSLYGSSGGTLARDTSGGARRSPCPDVWWTAVATPQGSAPPLFVSCCSRPYTRGTVSQAAIPSRRGFIAGEPQRTGPSCAAACAPALPAPTIPVPCR
eukprot:scaffold3415_cov368-Prasinococcus_capsulatus_cf.AAC.2